MTLHHLLKLGLLSGILLFSTQAFSQDQLIISENGAVATEQPKTPSEMEHTQTNSTHDMRITNSVKKLISQSKLLSKFNIGVQTNQGEVKLDGTVDSDSQFDLLVARAYAVAGVTDVDTANLKVKGSEQPVADSIITAKVKGLFVREKLFGTKDIAAMTVSVETKNGVVYLTGHVDKKQQIDNAIKLIKTVKGVTGVEYNVQDVTKLHSIDAKKDPSETSTTY